jgi:hypothetical protein
MSEQVEVSYTSIGGCKSQGPGRQVEVEVPQKPEHHMCRQWLADAELN